MPHSGGGFILQLHNSRTVYFNKLFMEKKTLLGKLGPKAGKVLNVCWKLAVVNGYILLNTMIFIG